MRIEEKHTALLYTILKSSKKWFKNDSNKIIKDKQMKATPDTGIIYSLTCKTTGKSYIGKSRDFKYTNSDVPYRYSLERKWKEHISHNCGTPIHRAIVEHGSDDFIVTELTRGLLTDLPRMQDEIIAFNNTLVPNGYNVPNVRSENKEIADVAKFYIETAASVEVNPIKRNGKNASVYVYVQDEDEDKPRANFRFGEANEGTYQTAVAEAMKFIEPFQEKGIPVHIHPEISGIEDRLSKYHPKLAAFQGKNITKIIITKQKWPSFTSIVIQIFVGKKKTQLSFGGKTIDFNDAYDTAKLFINRIKNQNTKIEETECLQEFLKKFATDSILMS